MMGTWKLSDIWLWFVVLLLLLLVLSYGLQSLLFGQFQ
jgi:hypothetical protein